VDAVTPSDAMSASEAEQGLWARARQTLSARQFEALELRVRVDLDVAAIAAAMGLTRTHVKVLLFRARRALIAAGADAELRESAAGRAATPAAAVAAAGGRMS
jgi:RNA polymerase sigma-70 factor (ECF subfamily)